MLTLRQRHASHALGASPARTVGLNNEILGNMVLEQRFCLWILPLVFSYTLNGQHFELMEELYAAAVFNDLSIKNAKGEKIGIADLRKIVYSCDTGFVSHPQIEYQDLSWFPVGLIELEYVNEFDTIVNKLRGEVDFYQNCYDDNGNYLFREYVFSVSENELSQIQDIDAKICDRNELTNPEEKEWLVEKIIFDSVELKVDSCYRIYKLCLKPEGYFSQSYNGMSSCEAVDFFPFNEEKILVKHILNIGNGIWTCDDSTLYFWDRERMNFIEYRIGSDGELIFLFSFGYQVYLRREKV